MYKMRNFPAHLEKCWGKKKRNGKSKQSKKEKHTENSIIAKKCSFKKKNTGKLSEETKGVQTVIRRDCRIVHTKSVYFDGNKSTLSKSIGGIQNVFISKF